MNKKQKNLKKASAAIAKIGLDCYQKGYNDSIDVIVEAFRALDSQGMKSISIDEAIVLVAQVRNISNGLHEAEPEPINGNEPIQA